MDIAEATVFETGRIAGRVRCLAAARVAKTDFVPRVQGHSRVGNCGCWNRWNEADEFVSDPAKPVPYTMEITTHGPKST